MVWGEVGCRCRKGRSVLLALAWVDDTCVFVRSRAELLAMV